MAILKSSKHVKAFTLLWFEHYVLDSGDSAMKVVTNSPFYILHRERCLFRSVVVDVVTSVSLLPPPYLVAVAI